MGWQIIRCFFLNNKNSVLKKVFILKVQLMEMCSISISLKVNSTKMAPETVVISRFGKILEYIIMNICM